MSCNLNNDINDRFELLILETADEYIIRKKKEKEELDKQTMKERKIVEEKGVCEGCEKKDYDEVRLRWVYNEESYICYECFVHDLSCQADVMVPMHRTSEMEDYMSEDVWDEKWEIEYIKKNCDSCKQCSPDYEDKLYCKYWNGLVE